MLHITKKPVSTALVKKKTRLWSYAIVRFVFLFGISFIILYPLLYMLTMAVRSSTDIYDPAVIWIPRHFTADNFRDAIYYMQYFKALAETVITSVGSTLLMLLPCAAGGYGLARFRFKGKNLIFALIIFSLIVPPQVTIIPMFFNMKEFDFFGLSRILELFTGEAPTINLLGGYGVYFLPAVFGMGLRGGLFTYIFRQTFRNLPGELEDAAYIDGCGFFRTFVKIGIPGAGSAFLISSIFSLVWYWNDYYMAIMYFSNKKTLPVALATLRDTLTSVAQTNRDLADFYNQALRIYAASLLMIVPILIFYLFVQMYFTESIERTGIVG